MNPAPAAPTIRSAYQRYVTDPEIKAATAYLDGKNPDQNGLAPIGAAHSVVLQGLKGSQKAFVMAAMAAQLDRPVLVVLPDREEALALLSDLDPLLPERHLMLFPASSRQPYQLEKIDNANVMQRAEVLTLVNKTQPGAMLIATWPEALHEKVISRTTLVTNTLEVEVGHKTGMEFLIEVLDSYGFEQVNFVREPGQYARRGGILDVFSFAYEYPYRLEFMGEEVESIRVFDPDNQLSIHTRERISLIPDVQNQLQDETRITFLEYMPPQTVVFLYDRLGTFAEADRLYEKALKFHESRVAETGGATVLSPPERIYARGSILAQQLDLMTTVELTASPIPNHHGFNITFEGAVQPHFRKEFELIALHLLKEQEQGIEIWLCCENERQLIRIKEIFFQLTPDLHFTGIIHTLSAGFRDDKRKIALYTDHEIFERYHRAKERTAFRRNPEVALRELLQLQPGDYITHINHGIGRFAGLERIRVGDTEQEAVKIIFSDDDAIYVNVNALYKISKYSGKEGNVPRLSKLGSGEWNKTKAKAKRRVKELAFDLIALYARRRAAKGYAFSPDSWLQAELEASFLYEETPDQLKATEDVKRDMEQPHPMDRLVCGDVGFGKTEVAVRAACKAAADGKQVCILVPTTILAMQHYNTFKDRMAGLPFEMEFVNRFKSKKEQTEIINKVKDGKIDIIIGTHRLLSKDVGFKDLGLLIIDEEHKFGVSHKEKLRLLRENVDTLTLTATPIPRTLQFSLLGIRDMSVIQTPPANRRPVTTTVTTFDEIKIRDAVAFELQRGGQVFFVHNRIKDLEQLAGLIKTLVPDARIAIAHGQQDGERIEETFVSFIKREYDVLVCTTLIESGLDIPNANTIIINQAHMYGLSDLHQMRGRVGRSNRKAYCYLLAPPLSTLPSDSRKRLQAIEEFSDLGSGIQIAMRDLDIRGAGDILGSEQSGYITEMGYEVYQKILAEAIEEIKKEQFAELFEVDTNEVRVTDCQVDIEEQALIPAEFVPNIAERLNIYKRISQSTTEDELRQIAIELQDRFGLIPSPVLALFDTIRLRELGKNLGIERISLAENLLRITFIADAQSPFYQSQQFQAILDYVRDHPADFQLRQKDTALQLRVRNVPNLKEALSLLRTISQAVAQQVVSA